MAAKNDYFIRASTGYQCSECSWSKSFLWFLDQYLFILTFFLNSHISVLMCFTITKVVHNDIGFVNAEFFFYTKVPAYLADHGVVLYSFGFISGKEGL